MLLNDTLADSSQVRTAVECSIASELWGLKEEVDLRAPSHCLLEASLTRTETPSCSCRSRRTTGRRTARWRRCEQGGTGVAYLLDSYDRGEEGCHMPAIFKFDLPSSPPCRRWRTSSWRCTARSLGRAPSHSRRPPPPAPAAAAHLNWRTTAAAGASPMPTPAPTTPAGSCAQVGRQQLEGRRTHTGMHAGARRAAGTVATANIQPAPQRSSQQAPVNRVVGELGLSTCRSVCTLHHSSTVALQPM